MGCQGNEFIVPSPSVDFLSNTQISKYQCPSYKNMWVQKNPTWGMISPSGPWTRPFCRITLTNLFCNVKLIVNFKNFMRRYGHHTIRYVSIRKETICLFTIRVVSVKYIHSPSFIYDQLEDKHNKGMLPLVSFTHTLSIRFTK